MKQMEWKEFKFKLIKSYSEKKNRTFHNNIFKCIIENYQKEKKSQGHKRNSLHLFNHHNPINLLVLLQNLAPI